MFYKVLFQRVENPTEEHVTSLLLLLLNLRKELGLGLGNLSLPGDEANLGGVPPLLGSLSGGLGLGRWVLADGCVALKQEMVTTGIQEADVNDKNTSASKFSD